MISLSSDQKEMLDKIYKLQTELTNELLDYWRQYSYFDTWQFWVNALILILPLVVLFIVLDRQRALLLGFYGFSAHVVFTYIDTFAIRLGLWDYPYQLLPIAPGNLGLDSSFVPVIFMLFYQWAIHYRKNYYLYGSLLVLVLAYVLRPLVTVAGLFRLHEGMHYYHLFLAYFTVMLLSKWTTNLFLKLQRISPLKKLV
jgi:hypothetical protein